MKRIILIFMSIIMIFSFAACNKGAGDKKAEDNNSGDISAVTVTPAEIEQKIAAAVGSENYLCDTEIDKDWLQNGFGLDLSKVESYSAKQNSISSVNPDTVIVLKTKDGYANCFSQFVIDDYAETHLIDLRFFRGSVKGYIEENGITQVLVLYNIPNFAQDTAVAKMPG